MKRYQERLQQYAALREQHPAEPLAFFAKHFSVDVGTVSRWNKALKKQSIKEEAIGELETRLRKEYETKLQTILEDKEQEREEAARKKVEAEQRKSENRRQHFRRILKECQEVDIYPSKTEDVTWQGFRYTLIGGQKNTVPDVIAGVWRESQKAQQRVARLISHLSRGQHLGKV